ncbi:hypothetical protein G4228_002835 [Cervus hanglu yarkandensis]|nr:hypothetical protein G4228_002835 [Cervus hanglu yarkandensis]
MSVKYEDLQYSESEKKSQGFTEVLFSFQAFLKRLLSSPCLLLLSLGLSLLLASVCVMGYQNFKFQSDLQTLRTGFSNFTSNTTAEVQALNSQVSQNTACCPANWLEHEGRCYWFSSLGKPWPEAEKDCQLKNAHLVVINSREEQDFIQANLRPYFTCMGLSDPDGVWKWVDGSDYETNIKNWKPGQPDDFHGHELGGGEDCAHFYPDGE